MDHVRLKDALQAFRLRRLVLDFIAEADCWVNPWLGSAWRGIMGHTLRAGLCLTGLPQCAPCPLVDACRYPILFEARPPATAELLKGISRAPGPYTLLPSPGGQLKRGERLSVELRLFGPAIANAALLVRALALGASTGAGLQGLRCKLQAINELNADGRAETVTLQALMRAPVVSQPLQMMPDWPGSFRIQLLTPLRLRVTGQYLRTEQLTLGTFLTALLRRVSLLLASYQNIRLDLPFRELYDQARALAWRPLSPQWQELGRRSGRQQRLIPMGGIVGEFEGTDSGSEAFWPLLWLGQWTMLGKGVSMGLGHYRLGQATDGLDLGANPF